MLRDVNITVVDGGMATSDGTGAQFKIGVSPMLSDTPIVVKSSQTPKRIQELLGLSPLADACLDSFDGGVSTLYCIPVAADVQGSVSQITKPESATATITVTGNPNNAYQVTIKVVLGGKENEAVIKYSLNGGLTYGEEITVPVGGQTAITPTGLTLAFTPGEKGFVAGDLYTFSTTAPSASNEKVLAAIDKLRLVKQEIELVHFKGESTNALWAAAAVKLDALYTDQKQPTFAVFEATAPAENQSLSEYVAAMKTARSSCSSTKIQVVTARGVWVCRDNSQQNINLAGVICGLYGRATVQQSIGEVNSFALSENKLLRLTPPGIEEYISELDDIQYLTVRNYHGLAGYYVTNAHMLAPEGSDFKYAELVRVTNKAIRQVRKAMLPLLHTYIDMDNLPAELAAMAKFAEEPLETMADAKEISSGRVIIPPDQDILSTEEVKLIIRFVPVGYSRAISVEMGMENPANSKKEG